MGDKSIAWFVSFAAKKTELSKYTINRDVIEDAIRTARLPKMCSIYLNARLGAPRVHHENEITIGTITLKEQMRLIGLAIHIGGISFDFLMDPLGINTLGEMETKLYRPAHLMFEGRTRAHVIWLSWSATIAKMVWSSLEISTLGLRRDFVERRRGTANRSDFPEAIFCAYGV